MTKIVILGASGQIARHVIAMLADRGNIELTLFLRDAAKLDRDVPANARIVEGNVLDAVKLKEAISDQDVVYANLAGNVDVQAQAIIAAMHDTSVRKLIFCTTLGIYDEVPGRFGKWNNREIGNYLPPYREAADLIEASGLDYAVLRPAWLTDANEIDYETSERNEPFKGTEVSRKSVADLVVKLVEVPNALGNRNIGINKPNTDGDKPAFM
ncbi:SDR family oxidoreductase [Brucella grignonensis]|uniref:3-beta hydroxysteroid dehydrogenase/isomerase family protein n=1 Tax=Brucella grignonensis TaxID=94627 RepID=A0A256F1T8_9HYPH|nr:SDR family oxidoreductase [Brucella grignonensis]NKB84607.1 SDR family oxidoreductase [Brucella grignonensis]OYR08680.1 3-beta hydroxysteroid dehydrogenase/isomerase family protein [Brucella grignonensis]